MSLGFEVLGRDGAARRGRLVTAHGEVDTPVFMPVGSCSAADRRFGAKPDKKFVDRQAAMPSSWKTPCMASCRAW